MGRHCPVCLHPDRMKIDRAIVRGESISGLSRTYDFPDHVLRRHRERHVYRSLVKSEETREFLRSKSLLEEINSLLAKAKAIMTQAEEEGKLTVALKAISESRNTIELMCKLAAHLQREEQKQEIDSKREEIDKLKNLNRRELEALQGLVEKAETGSDKDIDIEPLSFSRLDNFEDDDEDEPLFRKKKVRKKILPELENDNDNDDDEGMPFAELPDKDTDDKDGIDGTRDLEGFTHEERMKTRPRREVADRWVLDVKRARERSDRFDGKREKRRSDLLRKRTRIISKSLRS